MSGIEIERKINLVLPWPHRYLSPNSRAIWQVKHKIVKKTRILAYWSAVAKVGCGFEANPINGVIEVQFIAHPLDKRKRDEDNIIASMKSSLDGIADAIGVNDASFHFKELQISDTRKPPEIEVWLSWKELSGE